MSTKTGNETTTENAANAPATAGNTPAAAGTAPAKVKAPKGSSIEAQAKHLVSVIPFEINERLEGLNKELELTDESVITIEDLFDAGTLEQLTNVSAQLQSSVQSSLPLPIQLTNVNAEIAEHYTTFPKTGTPDREWEKKTKSLITRRDNIEKAQKAEAEKAKANAEGEKKTQGQTQS